jgi:hypothetical protein
MTVWFVEVPKLGGGWSPQLIHGDRPANKGSEGATRRFRAEPIEVRPDHLELSLAELQLLYQPYKLPADISPRYIQPQDRTDMAWELLSEIAAQKLGYEMEYPMNADWREGYETIVRKARALLEDDEGDEDVST